VEEPLLGEVLSSLTFLTPLWNLNTFPACEAAKKSSMAQEVPKGSWCYEDTTDSYYVVLRQQWSGCKIQGTLRE
jgi:hypothetical protein